MYIDSEQNANTNLTSHSDDGFLYHLARWGHTSRKSHNEAYPGWIEDKIKAKFPMNTMASCDSIADSIRDINTEYNRVSSNTEISEYEMDSKGSWKGSTEKDVVLNEISNRLAMFENLDNQRDCSEEYIQEQDDAYLEKVDDIFRSQEARDLARSQEDFTLMYVALGVGFLVMGSVIILANR